MGIDCIRGAMNKIIIFFLTLTSFLLSSCASHKAAEKNVEQALQNETAIKRSDVTENAREYILKSKTLSESQKKDLLSLFDRTDEESKTMTEEINKTKSVLIKTILQPNVNEREVDILNKKIKKISKKRMVLDSKSFTDARKIIDPLKEERDREFLYNSLMMRHGYYDNYW